MNLYRDRQDERHSEFSRADLFIRGGLATCCALTATDNDVPMIKEASATLPCDLPYLIYFDVAYLALSAGGPERTFHF